MEKTNGLLINYDYCTGCHTCEMACKVEHQFEEGVWGIELKQLGPREVAPDKWEYTFVPVPTALCDLCADRVDEGRWPTCVHHCQAQVMEYGDPAELAAKAPKKSALFIR